MSRLIGIRIFWTKTHVVRVGLHRKFEVKSYVGHLHHIVQVFAAGEQASDLQNQVSSELMDSMTKSIQEALNAESVKVTDTYGDGRHVSIDVIASEFEGKSAVKRQQAVYKAIWMELQETVHAVDSMTTKTPGEANSS